MLRLAEKKLKKSPVEKKPTATVDVPEIGASQLATKEKKSRTGGATVIKSKLTQKLQNKVRLGAKNMAGAVETIKKARARQAIDCKNEYVHLTFLEGLVIVPKMMTFSG